MPIEWEQYRGRFLANRPETYDAYVDVWQRMPDARRYFTSWADFSQCASAEPQRRRDQGARVATAEDIMQRAGYRIGPTTPRGARRWFSARSGPA